MVDIFFSFVLDFRSLYLVQCLTLEELIINPASTSSLDTKLYEKLKTAVQHIYFMVVILELILNVWVSKFAALVTFNSCSSFNVGCVASDRKVLQYAV